ncbi:TPA: DNA repair and recombination protein RadB [Methanocaldococcus jannaschii]|uniref:DNA repair and recombination protein RadB n=2 Tax=Methanocaldococcus jannaschii TaxID=2190 RepID=RADB_METJA|nr:DNA repair and recombination protein RadB [Methanocaldococcus jannaschii]Q57702.1 RecName: Full=DNA repair and recombination protein RadB [Methanocaldococcus jannaschii DSM 2661]AAB98241.1 DNA repair protein REC [Methanocaldococcus jannaschii DSM 2661]HII60134.1 DNA repair and recombination protein RadB [Methanocaldococcus jannaschii]
MLKEILLGNAEKGIITQIYGPPGVGKTNICIINSINAVNSGKVIYIDTEGGLSIERIKQIASNNYKIVLENMIIYNAFDFYEQDKIIQKELPLITNNASLIVVDNITSLYRLELSDEANKNIMLNKMLGNQVKTLLKLAKTNNLAVIITNQVRETVNGFEASGGRLLEYWSKCIVRLEKLNGDRLAILEKHLHAGEERVKFRIVERGIEIID